MTSDTAALTAALEQLQAVLDRAKATGDTRAIEGITGEVMVLLMNAQMHMVEAFATAIVDHERRIIAIEAELQGTAP